MYQRNQPIRLEPLNPRHEQERHEPPAERGDMLRNGYVRLSNAAHGIRPMVGGTPVWPPYREDC